MILILAGYKTYLAAFGLLVLGLVQIFGQGDVGDGVQSVLNAAGLFGLRAAISAEIAPMLDQIASYLVTLLKQTPAPAPVVPPAPSTTTHGV